MKQETNAPEAQSEYNNEWEQWAGLGGGFMFEVKSAYAYFEQVKDKRDARGLQYPIAAVLTMGVAWEAEWTEYASRDSGLGALPWRLDM